MEPQFRRELDQSFERVPIDFGKPMYVPLDKLPPEVIIKIVTVDPILPIETNVPRGWVIQPEDDVIYVSGGSYTLRLKDWGRIDFLGSDEKKKSVRTIFPCLSVLSAFTANFDRRYVTYRLQTGIIQSIVIDDFYSITVKELEENSSKISIDHLRRFKSRTKNRGGKNTARGRYKRKKYNYQPIIRR